MKKINSLVLIIAIGFLPFLSACIEEDEPTNNAPDIADQSFTLLDSSEPGAVIGEILAEDQDGDDIEFSIVSGNPNAIFSLNSSSGSLSLLQEVDFNDAAIYALSVQASDGISSSNATVTINVVEDNSAPEVADQSFEISDGAAIGDVVGTVDASDEDENDLTYTILSGNTNTAFSINASSGELTVSSQLNADENSSYTLEIQVSDGMANATANVTITVTSSNNPPTISSQSFEVSEGARVGTTIGFIEAVDPDGDDLSYSILDGNSEGKFSLDEVTGELTLEGSLDFNAQATYELEIQVSDSRGQADVGTFTINVLEVTQTMLEYINSDPNLSLFADEVARNGQIEALLSEDNPFTLLAPTNAAMQSLLVSVGLEDLSTVREDVATATLAYHILTSQVFSEDFTAGSFLTAQGENITINSDGSISSGATATATLQETDIITSNGVIHTIDFALVPPTIGAAIVSVLGTVAQPIVLSKDFSILADAIAIADSGKESSETILGTLTTAQDLTLFLPTNATFEAAGITANAFTAEQWDAIIYNHVVVGQGGGTDDGVNTLGPNDLTNEAVFNTGQGGALQFIVGTPQNGLGIFIDSDGDFDGSSSSGLDAEVVVFDAAVGSNGRIHVIAGVLSPEP